MLFDADLAGEAPEKHREILAQSRVLLGVSVIAFVALETRASARNDLVAAIRIASYGGQSITRCDAKLITRRREPIARAALCR